MQEYQNLPLAYAQGAQLAPQGFFGGLLGAPLGGLIGRGIGGLFGNAGLGNQIGQMAGGIGGAILPFSADPVAQIQQQQLVQQLQQQQQQQLAQQLAHAQLAQQLQAQQGQQGQFAPQGWFGNLIGQIGQPLGSAIGGIFGNAGLGGTIGNVAGQIGRILPFGVDPVANAYAQQQIAQQQEQHLAHQIAQQQLVQQQLAQQQLAQQQGQLGPQGWFGNLLGQVGQPLGTTIGNIFGNAGLGSTIGNVAGQLGRFLPFNADPVTAAYLQQAQQAQQAQQQAQAANSYYPAMAQSAMYSNQPTLH